MSSCIFCGGGTSDEHIIAQWLIRDCELDQETTEIGFGAVQGGKFELMREKQPIRKFLLTSVCTACNTGWMSQLENSAKKVLTPLLQKDWPVLDTEYLGALFPSCRDLALWLLKTAMTFGEKMSIRVPAYMRQELPRGRIYPGVCVDLACSELAGTRVAMTNQWNVVVEGEESIRQNEDSFRLTWQIRHLILRVSYFPYTARLQRKPRYPIALYPVFRIGPPYESRTKSGVTTLVKRYVYSNVVQFEHETTYYKTSALDPVLEELANPIVRPW